MNDLTEELDKLSMIDIANQDTDISNDLRFAAIIVNLLTSLKIPRKDSIEYSKNLIKLSHKLSIKNEIVLIRTRGNLISGLIGNTTALYPHGISLDSQTLKQYAYENGIAAQDSELSKQQKIISAYGELISQGNK